MCRDREQTRAACDLGQKWELTANSHKGGFGNDGRILKLSCDDGTAI